MAEMQNTEIKGTNPLTQYFRQPKIWIKLPSGGKFYPNNALDHSANDEYPVFAMTAKDELLFKTPDALLSGQSTVEVIKSCIPAIREPWMMPSIDVDAALIAIRLATYGENMEVTVTCPSCKEDNDYTMNLRVWLGQFDNFEYNDSVDVDPLTVKIRPYSYREITKASLQTLEQQKLVQIATDDTISDDEKIDRFQKGFIKLTDLTVDLIAGCITRIETPDGIVSDLKQIKEFIDNAPKDVFDKVHKHVSKIKHEIDLKPQDMKCAHCESEFTTPITMDQSNFFAVRS
jgi:hypothetical protein